MMKFKVSRALVSHPTREAVEVAFICGGVKRTFELTSAEAATLARDLTPHMPSGPAMSDAEAAKASGLQTLPSVLPLPLITGPITTMSVLDNPDALGIEMRMKTEFQSDSFQRVRFPMMADTARELIAAIEDRLNKIGQATPEKS